MTHPTQSELADFLHGKLTVEASESLSDHLADCPPCQDTIRGLEAHGDTLLDGLKQKPAQAAVGSECRRAMDRAAALMTPASDKSQSVTSPTSLTSPSVAAATPKPVAAGPVPTREQFLASLQAANILDDEQQATLRQSPAVAQAADGAALARALVECGLLTKFQATLVYQNKPKGLLFGEYIVLDRIGAGGMGQVFKAKHRRMDRVVALKVLAPAAMKSPDAVRRFQREVKAAAKLVHPNIVIAHDAGEQDGVHYLVMEFVPGCDLSALIKREGPLPLDKVIAYVLQAARGLAFAHAKGVVHRDIKPGNLLVDAEGTVRILDMGLARLDGDLASKAAGEALTQTGAVMGTVDYMAPEQAFDTSKADAKADVYSLGCTLYRLATGQNLFTGDTLVQKILAHRESPIPSLRMLRAEATPQLDGLFQRLVAKRPEDRPTMAELVGELETLAAGEATATYDSSALNIAVGRTPPSTAGAVRKPPNRKLVAAAAAGFLFICYGIWVIVRNDKGDEVGRMQVPAGGTVVTTENILSSPSTIPKAAEVTANNRDSAVTAKAIEVLKNLQPRVDSSGSWHFEKDGVLVGTCAEASKSTTLPFSLEAPDEYDLESEFGHLDSGGIILGAVAQSQRFYVKFDLAGKYQAELGLVDGLAQIVKNPNPASVPLTGGHKVKIVVRRDRVQVLFHHQIVINFTGDLKRLSRNTADLKVYPDFFLRTTGAARFRMLKLTPAPIDDGSSAVSPVTSRVPVDVLLLGGRPIVNWKTTGSAAWQKYFPGYTLLNWADGGRTVGGMIKDAERIEAENVDPRVILTYVNGSELEHMRRAYASGIARLRQVAPQAKIIMVSTIAPFTPDGDETVRAWNDAVHALADDTDTFYFDLSPVLLDAQGRRLPDRLIGQEITVNAYEAWAEALQPLLMKLLPSTAAQAEQTPAATSWALHFDGKSSVVLPQLQAATLTNFCFEAIVTPRQNDPDVKLRGIISWPVNDAELEHFGLTIANENSKALWKAKVGAKPPAMTAQGTVRWNQPLHVAVSNSETNLTLFLDGKPVNSVDPAKPILLSKLPLVLGTFFQGDMHQLRISTTSRYSEEFTPISRFESDKETLLLYRFEEGKGDVLQDASGHNYHAKILNAKWIRVSKVANAVTILPPKTMIPPPARAPFTAAMARDLQQQWARLLNLEVKVSNSVQMGLSLIPAGEFSMGSSPEQLAAAKSWAEDAGLTADNPIVKRIDGEAPAHRVTISQPFLFGSGEVTLFHFRQFVDATGYITDAERWGSGNSSRTKSDTSVGAAEKAMTWRAPGYEVNGNTPVTQVTRNDCIRFCNWLSEREGLPPAYVEETPGRWRRIVSSLGYRLPTEAEWEFACQAGSMTLYSFGNDQARLADYAWFEQNSSRGASDLARRKSNSFGMYDMHGNVAEQCEDWFAANAYARSPEVDPTGPSAGQERVCRGGSWNSFAECRSAARSVYAETFRSYDLGFRVARSLPPVVKTDNPRQPIDLLENLQQFNDKNGNWSLDQGILDARLTGAWQSSLMPLLTTFPREYDLHAVIERMEGKGDVQFGLTSGEARFIVFLNSTNVTGPVIIGPDSKVPFVRLQKKPVLANSIRSDIVIRVRTNGVEVVADQDIIARYSGPIDELSPGQIDAAMSDAFLRVYQRTRFHTLEVLPATKPIDASTTPAPPRVSSQLPLPAVAP